MVTGCSWLSDGDQLEMHINVVHLEFHSTVGQVPFRRRRRTVRPLAALLEQER